MKENRETIDKELYELMTSVGSLPYEDEFLRVKVKTNALDEFLEEVASGAIRDTDEFIKEGMKRTISPALLSIIKEKLRRFAKKFTEQKKGAVARFTLALVYKEVPLHNNPFFIAIFVRSASRRPLANNRRVWKFLYELLPKRIEEGNIQTLEEPELRKLYKEGYEEQDSGLLIPKKKEKKTKESTRIIIPGKE